MEPMAPAVTRPPVVDRRDADAGPGGVPRWTAASAPGECMGGSALKRVNPQNLRSTPTRPGRVHVIRLRLMSVLGSLGAFDVAVGHAARGSWSRCSLAAQRAQFLHTRHQRPTPAGAGAAARTPSRTTHRRSDRHTLPDRVPRSGVAMWSSRLHGSHAPAGPTPGQGPLPRPGTASTPLKEPCRSMLRRRSPERGGSDSYTTSRDATAVRGRCGSRAV